MSNKKSRVPKLFGAKKHPEIWLGRFDGIKPVKVRKVDPKVFTKKNRGGNSRAARG